MSNLQAVRVGVAAIVLATGVMITPNPIRDALSGETSHVAQASHCSGIVSAPFVNNGRLRATGGASCSATQLYLDVRLRIIGTGPGCGSPCTYADSGWDAASNVSSNNVAVNSTPCGGSYSVWATLEWRAPLHGGTVSSTTKSLTC